MRAAVLFIVVLMAFVLLYSNVQNALTQQQQNASLRAQIQQAQGRSDALQQELNRWQDPAYVAAQARDRLAYVMPGEVPFRVVDPETVATPAPTKDPSAPDSLKGGPWYGTLWQSVRSAGASATGHENESEPSADGTVGTEQDVPAPSTTAQASDAASPANP